MLPTYQIQKATQNESKEKKRIKDLKVGPKTIKLLEEGKPLMILALAILS